MKCSRRTVQRAVDVLAEDRWIEIRQIGENGTVNAHIINDRVAWSGKRDGLRYSLFSAAVTISEAEQPDFEELGQQAPPRRLPSLFRDARHLPSGPGPGSDERRAGKGRGSTCRSRWTPYHQTKTTTDNTHRPRVKNAQ